MLLLLLFTLPPLSLAFPFLRSSPPSPPPQQPFLSPLSDPRDPPLRATWLPERDIREEDVENGWFDPRREGGRLLDRVGDAENHKGEPLNVIISGDSDPEVLTEDGLVEFSRSIIFAPECLNQHRGRAQGANLGDGQGWLDELYELRQTYFPVFGTCMETLIGGNHFRAWKQNGTLAPSGAWFLAASKEVDLRGHHKIRPNGYNDGRDLVVDLAVRGSCWKGKCFRTRGEYISGLLRPGKDGVNHGIAQDGRVAVLHVDVLDVPEFLAWKAQDDWERWSART